MKRKAQVISVDFVLTFVVYIMALSMFFFYVQDSVKQVNYLDLNTELIFSKLDNIFDNDYSFLDGSKIVQINNVLSGYDEVKAYDLYFKEFENQQQFRKIDYCIFIQNKTSTGIQIMKNFAAHTVNSENLIYFNLKKCGQTNMIYGTLPFCNITKADSIIMSKPVLYKNQIMELKVLACAEKR
jgi:hypothetical protein